MRIRPTAGQLVVDNGSGNKVASRSSIMNHDSNAKKTLLSKL